MYTASAATFVIEMTRTSMNAGPVAMRVEPFESRKKRPTVAGPVGLVMVTFALNGTQFCGCSMNSSWLTCRAAAPGKTRN
jgi:hypothetical protein